ncbi:unnamed protein product (macronuclear) [Paramecium tetraurelia]|uniref:Uncharacterized protein n=1 Tax=Paramecium tetraurelia TaxID=5888 RepID=A0E1Y5_PARTE|nr:uncharacterized protein GSPATT00022473001 [Paramecium tetraurelia]CAK89302.1 unnamed protein product [Paramecium tetraurelia]|eukprot:XP_001456699.1 hypothetical protein (macronuclear) [Paramecium tetraurelia strain d4-2]
MKKSIIRPINQLNSPSISHYRSQTSGSGVIDQSRILEETSERFQRTWNILESVEELKSVREIVKQVNTEPSVQCECQLGGTIISGKVYKVAPMEFYYCNIGTRGQKSPLNCSMFCDGEFQIMISFNSPYPTKFNCDQVIRSRQWAVRHNGEDKLNLAVVARKQTDIKFMVHFGQADSFRKLVRMTSNHDRIPMSEIPRTPQFIVNQNKVLAVKKVNKFEIEVSRSDRFLQVLKTRNLQKKSMLEASQMKSLEFKAKEWAHDEYKLITSALRNRDRRREQKYLWFELLYYIKLVDKLQTWLQQRRKQLMKNKMMVIGLQLRIKTFREKQQKERGDILHRVVGDTVLSLMMYCKQARRRLIHNSLGSVMPLLKWRASLYMFKKKAMITSGKLQLIKLNLNQFVRNVREYKAKMIQKWDQYTLKVHSIPSLQKMDKRFITWIKYLYEKGYQAYFQNQFITLLMRDRYRSHIREQREIKKFRLELKAAKLQLRFSRDTLEIVTLRQRIFKLNNDIFAMQVKNQFFIHSDVERFVSSILEQSSFIFLDEDSNQLNQEKQSRIRVSLKRQKTMRISKNL